MKKVIYQHLYKLLNSLSSKINNPYLNQYKIAIGTTLLFLTSGCNPTKGKSNNEKEKAAIKVDSIEKKMITEKNIPDKDTIIVTENKEDTTQIITCYFSSPANDYENVSESDTTVYYVTEKMPRFPEGNNKLRELLTVTTQQPEDFIVSDQQPIVHIQMIIEKDGSLSDIQVVRNAHPKLDSIAIETVKHLPKFEPGTYRGYSLRVRFSLPVRFKFE